MLTNKLLIVVIKTPNSNRYLSIDSALSSDERFKVVYINATMLKSALDLEESKVQFIPEEFLLYEGRMLLPTEIGCADSHNRARLAISESESGGVILEDDARISDIESFFAQCTRFLGTQGGKSSVLSLTGFRAGKFQARGIQEKLSRAFFPLRGHPDLAVAYVITPKAALSLVEANTPIMTVSDWPISKCEYFASAVPPILHGDQTTISTILQGSTEFRYETNLIHKIKLLTFMAFFRNRHSGIRFTDYLERVYLSRVYWFIDTIYFMIKIFSLRRHDKWT